MSIHECKPKILTKEKLSREKYKEIKSLNREELNNYIYSIYVLALEDAFKTIAEHELFTKDEFKETFETRINELKGIGKGKKEIIENMINQIFDDLKTIKIETNVFEEEEQSDVSASSRKAV